jgi:hypothetical protein
MIGENLGATKFAALHILLAPDELPERTKRVFVSGLNPAHISSQSVFPDSA